MYTGPSVYSLYPRRLAPPPEPGEPAVRTHADIGYVYGAPALTLGHSTVRNDVSKREVV